MPNSYFKFKQFTIQQDACAMKVCTDACLFGAWCAATLHHKKPAAKNGLDVGTGTGLLSLLMRQQHRLAIDALEIDAAAAAQAQQNVVVSPWPESISIHTGDVLQHHFSKRYDVIVSNPPFYESDLKSKNQKRNTALHSAALSLHQLLTIISENLEKEGWFFLLLPFRRREEIRQLVPTFGLFIHEEVHVQQSAKHAPFRIMLRGGLEPADTFHQTLIISENANQYTPAFTALLHDYYLYL